MFKRIRQIWDIINYKTEPRRAHKAVEQLHSLVEMLNYYMGDNPRFRSDVLSKAMYIEDAIHEIASDQRLISMKLSKRLRHIWKVDEHEEELKELKKKITTKEFLHED